jgi:hypothetical protein
VRPDIELFLLRDSLVQLTETTYFKASLHEFTDKLIEVIGHVTSNKSLYHIDVVRQFATNMRLSQRYLFGSTTREAPYEVGYCLEKAATPWVSTNAIIMTGLTYGHDFHFALLDPWKFITLNITGFNAGGFDSKLIYIGVPRLYVHKPIYCIPLYHELGHFVDTTFGVTKQSLLLSPVPRVHLLSQEIATYHRMEHFADVFCASYVGEAAIEVLMTIAPNDPATRTHPSTIDRVKVLRSYLSGTPSSLTDLITQALATLSAPPLAFHFQHPSVTSSYDDIRPYDIVSDEELHGIFLAAWNYLSNTLDNKRQPWAAGVDDRKLESIINDLTEKSIRNYAIRERWARGASS